jgi:hypothetical protein
MIVIKYLLWLLYTFMGVFMIIFVTSLLYGVIKELIKLW